MDDEGTLSQCTTLIENGRLVGYMQDKLNARLMGMAPTGNGRRQSFAHLPMPRMTNTCMLPGPHAPEEIIASVDRGIYARNFASSWIIHDRTARIHNQLVLNLNGENFSIFFDNRRKYDATFFIAVLINTMQIPAGGA